MAPKTTATLTSDSILSNTQAAIELYNKSRFGELKAGKVIYSIYEALYLVENKKISLLQRGREVSFDQLLKKAKRKDKKIFIKYLVFKDMRQKGYIVKTALKFGADFRIYDKGKKPGQTHAKWILYPVEESSTHSWHEFTAKTRVAHSTNKNLLIAIVDQEQDISYYEIRWTKP